MLTVRDEPGAMGKRGFVIPAPYIRGPKQHFRMENALAFPGCVKFVCTQNPNHVLRFTPASPGSNLSIWENEPGSPNQCWGIAGDFIHPQGHPNMFLHVQGERFTVGPAASGVV